MAQIHEILTMLIPTGGWATTGQDYESILFIDCEPITKKEFEDGVAKFDAWKLNQEIELEAKKNALLDRLGITADEAALLFQ